MLDKILNKSTFYFLLISIQILFSNNIVYAQDSIRTFPENFKKQISPQLKEIWGCEEVKFEFEDNSHKNIIIDLGVISSDLIKKTEDLILASRFILNNQVKSQYGFIKGKLRYRFKTNDNIERKEFSIFTVINSIPIAEDCNDSMNQTQLKACFKNYVKGFFEKNFNPEKFKNIGLENNTKHKAVIGFIINKEADIKNIYVLHHNELIKSELSKIAEQLNIVSPSYKNGKPYDIKYEIPIYFLIE